MRRAVYPLVALALLAGPLRAGAKLCGDAVGGQDVPCACGDVIVSDVVLGATDPVTQGPCPHDGLVVRAPQAASVTVDLHGQTLRGVGHGAGVLLVDGRARVVSTGGAATIAGFQDGIYAHGDTAAALIADVVITGSRRDGLRIEAPGVEVRDTIVRDAGRDGVGLAGKRYKVTGTRAEGSRRHGFAVWGSDGTVTSAVAVGSGATGFNVMGMGHALTDCSATGGGGDGIKLWGMHFSIVGCEASSNAGDGIEGMGMDWHFAGDRAVDNGGNGLHAYGYWLIDDGGNQGSGNRGIGKRQEPEQCEIGDWPCRP
jgi:parallel beta helix pectate lyase-like protein